jgi:uncharacterized protein (TIGR00251 family)
MLKETKEGCLLDIEVRPHSERFEVEGLDPWQNRIKIRVKSSPIKGRANRELLKEMASLTKADVEVVKGDKSTKKTLLIRAQKGDVKRRLGI